MEAREDLVSRGIISETPKGTQYPQLEGFNVVTLGGQTLLQYKCLWYEVHIWCKLSEVMGKWLEEHVE
jgi:hypothetical protein